MKYILNINLNMQKANSKIFGGFEHKIFTKPVNMDLICVICSCKIILTN